jgi:hypothetical protein
MSHTPTSVTAALDLSPVRAAVARVERAEEEVTRARAAVADARRVVTAALVEVGRAVREGRTPLPDGLVHELYWDWDEVRVKDIARAFGLSASEVARVAGPAVVTGRCARCGGSAEGSKLSRSAYVHLVCDVCREAQQREDEEERKQLEVREALRDLVAEWERRGELPYRYERGW